jgi:hypothetical protein
MAHLWHVSDENEWRPFPLDGVLFALPSAGEPQALVTMDRAASGLIALRCADGPDDEAWFLLAGGEVQVCVNGVPIPHGMAALADRDEIRRPGSPPCFFSTERLAHVATYPADGARGFCPRCKQPIAAGDPAVKCPGCGLWHHASENRLPCWTYGGQCAACSHPTSLDAGFQWTPAEL